MIAEVRLPAELSASVWKPAGAAAAALAAGDASETHASAGIVAGTQPVVHRHILGVPASTRAPAMSFIRPRRTTLSRIALGLLLLGCGGGGAQAPTAPPPVPPEPLPVLSQLIIIAPGDTVSASETVPAALVARDIPRRGR